jgi:hypothetical protein
MEGEKSIFSSHLESGERGSPELSRTGPSANRSLSAAEARNCPGTNLTWDIPMLQRAAA